MSSGFAWSFTTAAAPTLARPCRRAARPAWRDLDAATATFSQSMQAASIVFTLKDRLRRVGPGVDVVQRRHSDRDLVAARAALGVDDQYTATVGGGTSTAGFDDGRLVLVIHHRRHRRPAAKWIQTTAADFNAGSRSSTAVTDLAGGEIQLAPGLDDDFGGTSLGSSWTTASYSGAARYAVSGGILSLSGGAATRRPPISGVPVEARLDIGAAAYQHFGLATGLASPAGNSWAIFSTMGTTGTLYARVNANGATTDLPIGALPVGYHDYLIRPAAGGYQFLVDGVLRATVDRSTPAGAAMRLAISSFDASGSAPVRVPTGSAPPRTPRAGRSPRPAWTRGGWRPGAWPAGRPACRRGPRWRWRPRARFDGAGWSPWQPATRARRCPAPTADTSATAYGSRRPTRRRPRPSPTSRSTGPKPERASPAL